MPLPAQLTEREQQIAQHYAQGKTYKEIARALHISPSTVRNHITRIYAKLEIGNKAELIQYLHTSPIPAEPDTTHPPDGTSEPLASYPPEERRQVTVMVARLTDVASPDLEQLQRITQRFHDDVSSLAQHYQSHVARYDNGTAQVYFGYPSAHEDDAERAVRASLQLLACLDGPNDYTGKVCIGLASGEAVFAADPAGKPTLFGPVAEQAQKLAELAKSDEVLLSAASHQLAGQGFQYLPYQTPPQPEYADIGRIWQAQSLKPALRFESRLPTLSPLVGRDAETQLLLERWTSAQQSEGQAVLLSGGAGIGKSRLVHTLLERTDTNDRCLRLFQCSPFYTQSALQPFITYFNQQLESADADTTKLDQLANWASLSAQPTKQSIALLATLLSIPLGTGYTPLRISPQLRKQATLTLFTDMLLATLGQQPLLLIIEDVHWLDPTSLELLGQFIERIPTLPVLLVVTTRPEFDLAYSDFAHITKLSINRLSTEQALLIVDTIASGTQLAAPLRQDISNKTDGVPLFVEEVTKAILESQQSGVPATLYDSLLARLDCLGPAKEIAQIGSVIGRELSHDLLAKVAGLDEKKLQNSLNRLIEAGLLFHQGGPDNASYFFKHALIRDVAYDTLLQNKRQSLHARIAKALEQSTAQVEPELLAQHYTAADLARQAIPYWYQAGKRAVFNSAYDDAINHIEKGLALIDSLPENDKVLRDKLDLLVLLGSVQTLRSVPADLDVEETYRQAHTLCRQLDDQSYLGPILNGMRSNYMRSGNVLKTRAIGEELLCIARRQENPTFFMVANRALGLSYFYLAEFDAARKHLQDGASQDVADDALEEDELLLYENDSRTTCLSYLSKALWLLGYPDQALHASSEALERARSLPHISTFVETLSWRGILFQFRCQPEQVLRLTEEQISLCKKHNMLFYMLAGLYRQGWALAQLGRLNEGLNKLQEGLDGQLELGVLINRPYNLYLKAEVCEKLGAFEQALTTVEDAFAIANKTEQFFWHAELYRLKGQLLLKSPPADQAVAEACYHKAIDTAHRQEAKSLELRAATSLARLWREQGKRAQAQDMLTPVYHWFSEGFDTPDLKDAKALLGEL